MEEVELSPGTEMLVGIFIFIFKLSFPLAGPALVGTLSVTLH